MKKSFLLAILAFSTGFSLQSQPYSFSVSNSNYNYLSSSVSLNNGLTWDDPNLTVPLGFNFNYFGINVDTVKITFGLGGTLLTSINSNGIGSLLSPFGADLIDRGYSFNSGPGQSGSLSNISYQTSGAIGARICKIQWKNAGFYGDVSTNGSSASDSINFQLWLYEGIDLIELHMGPNSIASPQLSYYGYPGADFLLIPSFNFNNFAFGANYYCLSGSVNSPSFQTRTPSDTILYLNGTIPDGTVYRFSPVLSNTKELIAEKMLTSYPNPAHDEINLRFKENSPIPNELSLIDLNGRVVKVFHPSSKQLDIQEIHSGIYFLVLRFERESIRHKILIE